MGAFWGSHVLLLILGSCVDIVCVNCMSMCVCACIYACLCSWQDTRLFVLVFVKECEIQGTCSKNRSMKDERSNLRSTPTSHCKRSAGSQVQHWVGQQGLIYIISSHADLQQRRQKIRPSHYCLLYGRCTIMHPRKSIIIAQAE